MDPAPVVRQRAHWTRYRYFKTLLVMLLLGLLAVGLVFTGKRVFTMAEALAMSGIAVPDSIADDTVLPILSNSVPQRADGVQVQTTTGRTGPVVHQKLCSSCWAFALACMLADRHAVFNGVDPRVAPQMSPQSLLDAANSPGNRIAACYSQGLNKCQCGESPFYASSLAVEHGMLPEGCVEYRAGKVSQARRHEEGQCFEAGDEHKNCFYLSNYHYDPCDEGYLKFKSVQVSRSERIALQELLNNGTVMCVIGITHWFKDYTDGVIEKRSNEEDAITGWHAVCLVGYEEDNDGGVWRVKNSWGSGWGENGYFRMRYGENVLCVSSVFPFFFGFF